MKLTEIKNKDRHYFKDEQGRMQGDSKWWWDNGVLLEHGFFIDGNIHGEYKSWHRNGQPSELSYLRNSKLHGERKMWNSEGKVVENTFGINGKELVNFLENPELYPTTPEEKTMFVLKYGNAPLIGWYMKVADYHSSE